MIDFALTDAQRETQRTARAFAEREILPRIHELDSTSTYDRSLYEKMGAEGFLGLPIPERYGGAGMDYIAFALLCEEMERADTAFRVILSVHTGLNSLTLLQWGSEEQKQQYLVPQARGEKLATFGLTEPEAGSDAASIRARAVADGDSYVITGTKRFITNGSVAGLITVFAVTDPDAPRHRRLSCFAVEVPAEGFRVERLEHKLGIRGSPTAELSFNAVRLPAANRIGAEGDGFGIAMATLDRSRPGVAAQAVGIAQGALDVAVAYARERKQFGQRIGDFQMIAAMLADMDAQTEAARQLLYTACGVIEAGDADAARWSAMCKLVAGDTAMRVTTDAVQVLGGYGYMREYPVEKWMRDAKIMQIYEGTAQIQRLVIARRMQEEQAG